MLVILCLKCKIIKQNTKKRAETPPGHKKGTKRTVHWMINGKKVGQILFISNVAIRARILFRLNLPQNPLKVALSSEKSCMHAKCLFSALIEMPRQNKTVFHVFNCQRLEIIPNFQRSDQSLDEGMTVKLIARHYN